MVPKFRAWDKDSKVMREIQHLVWAEDNLIAHCPPRGHEFSEWFTVILNGWEYQLMQSTGLKDKNGVEIFEGDVYRYKYYTGGGFEYRSSIIEWETTEIAYEGVFHGYEFDNYEIEVIGNVWEDGDLINDSEGAEEN